ncbi:MAG: hypothetical protein JNL82_09425 [Myxococcales bacterium]|nr:hypothetical protein [Myxococcales bacterium]
MRHVFLCAAVAVASAAACDPQEQAAATAAPDSKGAKVDGKQPPTTATPPTKAGDAPVTFKSLSACLETCDAPGMIPTNRETCRLNCDNAYGAQPGAAAGGADADVIGTAATCLGRCYADDASSEACASACKSTAAAAPTAPSSAVLDELGTCIRTCGADKKLRPTNEATCELNCTQLARVAGPARPAAAP